MDKRYDPKKVEEGKYETWCQKGYFTCGDLTKKPYSIVIPPPNVTGKLHLGHAWDTTIQDIICRYKRMKGYDVLFLPGMDHAGIATEAKVSEKLRNSGINPHDLSRDEFLTYAWQWKDEYASSIHEQWKKFGLSLDYSKERFTLDEGMQKAVKKVFVQMYKEGLIYQGQRIINWDPVQMTALSNVEVIHSDDLGKMYYFKYRLVDSDEYLTVATTRPETMFGDVCLVVNPKDKRYTKYIGKKVINPANKEVIEVICDEYVDVSFGTGVMKCTPAHDPNDFLIGEKYHLEKPVIMTLDGKMNEHCGKYQGLDRYDCREALLKELIDNDDFIKEETITHSVGHSERSGAVVEPMISKQWFVKMKPLAQKVIETQKGKGKVNFIPQRFNNTLIRWMDNIEDWCISRQLRWGHRIPAYYSKIDGSVIVSEEAPKDINNYEQDSDVLDTWFSSALWPFATLNWPDTTDPLFQRYFPTSALITGYDIIFFWVSRMMVQSLHFNNQIPFRNVIIHGLCRDELGRKMSKTLGNGVDPLVVIDKYGADALRYFLTTNTAAGLDMRYSENKVVAASNYLNKVYNSARYVLSVLPEGFKPVKNLSRLDLSPLNQWIINKMEEVTKKVTTHMEHYNFNQASSLLYDFVYDDFCSTYIEMSKVSLQSEEREVTYQVLYYCLKNIVLMLSPFTPFISEEIYLSLPSHRESVNLETYPKYHAKWVNKESDELIDSLVSAIKVVRNYKIERKISPNQGLVVSLNYKGLYSYDITPLFKRFTFTDELTINDKNISKKEGSLYTFSSFDLLIVEEETDKDAILKEIEYLKSEINRCESLLSNPSFVSKAPKEKVELEQAKKKKHEENLKALLSKLK
ncbi:MAG: valine--tRNA ligase [Coprobacillus sp.]|nr:valine--tRNA ligase [Coprobacillus sp.]